MLWERRYVAFLFESTFVTSLFGFSPHTSMFSVCFCLVQAKAPTLPKLTRVRGRFWIDSSLEHALDQLARCGIYSAQIMERKAGEICVKENRPSQALHAPEYIGRLDSYSEKDCRAICRQLAKAIQTMHISGVAHRHLHVENVLINAQVRLLL